MRLSNKKLENVRFTIWFNRHPAMNYFDLSRWCCMLEITLTNGEFAQK